MQLTTQRLIIRPWQTRDLPAFGTLNADPEVRRYYHPAILTQAESDAVVEQCMRHLNDHGFAFLALERREDRALIGGAGLSWTDVLPGGPAVEIGWILARQFWRQGYASEASQAWLAHGWSIGVEQIVGYTSAVNHPSRRLMEALGMARNPEDDFLDPTVPEDSPLSPHVLYRIHNPRG
ncbi:GNAT family N-acetyltransferase [Parvibaculum sp.]|uniref:GNAT family N-acetyltransferase n=1 Tax=Parvibaculum sp. TaxID=2024848 RepID=UPI0025CFD7C1|nr:GNAT family N-acetyltransferase [Parvibaculum sp.]